MIIRKPIGEAIAEYRDWIDSRDYAASTQQTYLAKMDRFETVYRQYQADRRHIPYVCSISPGVVTAFFRSYRNYTRNDALKVMRSFLRWSVRMKYIDPADVEAALGDRKAIPFNRRPKHYIPAERFQEALEIAGERHPHDRAFLALMLFTLCRVSEVITIKLKDFDLAESEAGIYRQKKKRWTTEIIPIDLREEMDIWLSWYAQEMGYPSPRAMMTAHPDWLLLPRLTFRSRSVNGTFTAGEGVLHPESPCREMEWVIKRVLAGLGIDGEMGLAGRTHLGEGTHCVRRSGARALFLHLSNEIGRERALIQVSAKLDHKDLKTTLLYIGIEIEKRELDQWLRSNRMYGDLRRPPRQLGGGTVVPLHGPERAVGAIKAPGASEAPRAGIQAI